MEQTKLDSLEFDVLNFPYNKIASELSNVQRIAHGKNTYVTLGGNLAKRPGTPKLNTNATITSDINKICDRIWIYETIDNPPIVYLIGSFRTAGGLWELRYINLDVPNSTWTLFTEIRNCNHSVYPHELVVHRGLAFIKSFPLPSFRINSGGSAYTDNSNLVWSSDQDWILAPNNAAPQTLTTTHIIDMTGVGGASFTQTLAQSQRTSSTIGSTLQYVIPMPPGIYDVNLLFADVQGASVGANILAAVTIQNTIIATNYDIVSVAGASYKAAVLSASSVNSSSSPIAGPPNIYITIFTTGSNKPKLNAIEIKPHNATDPLGSIIFDGSGGSPTNVTPQVKFWGELGPQTPAGCSAPSGWGASDHSVTVLYNWGYVYSYVDNANNVSSHSPIQTDPTLNPSFTGSFTNKIPQVTLTGSSADDLPYLPWINVYRTTDGGGTFYFLQQIPNQLGNITYKDNNLLAGSTRNDPIPDTVLDTTRIAPPLLLNGPPPSANPPSVIGIASVQRSSPPITYAGRIWYAIGNYIYYSGLEELGDGVPECCFPSGLNGNYFQLPHPVLYLKEQPHALLIVTTQASYWILGQSKDTFIVVPFLNDVGGPYGHPRAITAFNNSAAWLTQDYRIAVVNNGSFQIISDPLYDDLKTAITNGAEIGINHWALIDKDYLIINAYRTDNISQSQQWIYDIKKSEILNQSFWFTPWTIPSTACTSGRTQQNSSRNLIFAVWDNTNTDLSYLDSTATTGYDYTKANSQGYSFLVDTHLMHNPAGNHLNILSLPTRSPVIEFLQLTESFSPGQTLPEVYSFIDDFWTKPIPLNPELDKGRGRLPRTNQPKGYNSTQYNIHRDGQKCAIRITKSADSSLYELQHFLLAFDSVSGD